MSDIAIPRERLEAIASQVLAMREQLDSLSRLVQYELKAAAAPAVDPRTKESPSPPTFGRRSA